MPYAQIRTNDMEKLYETRLGQMTRDCMQEVRSDRGKEKSYMTYMQKMLDERLIGYQDGLKEGREEGRAEGHEEGREEGRKEGREEGREKGREESVAALKGFLAPDVIAERFQMPLEQVLKILGS